MTYDGGQNHIDNLAQIGNDRTCKGGRYFIIKVWSNLLPYCALNLFIYIVLGLRQVPCFFLLTLIVHLLKFLLDWAQNEIS